MKTCSSGGQANWTGSKINVFELNFPYCHIWHQNHRKLLFFINQNDEDKLEERYFKFLLILVVIL